MDARSLYWVICSNSGLMSKPGTNWSVCGRQKCATSCSQLVSWGGQLRNPPGALAFEAYDGEVVRDRIAKDYPDINIYQSQSHVPFAGLRGHDLLLFVGQLPFQARNLQSSRRPFVLPDLRGRPGRRLGHSVCAGRARRRGRAGTAAR